MVTLRLSASANNAHASFNLNADWLALRASGASKERDHDRCERRSEACWGELHLSKCTHIWGQTPFDYLPGLPRPRVNKCQRPP